MTEHVCTQILEDFPLDAPRTNGSVWPYQSCPAFSPKNGAAAKVCWYCSHGDFHLANLCIPDSGRCCWPQKFTCK